jgi:molybdopterin/thiamine biosynthesis adenylyltransferase
LGKLEKTYGTTCMVLKSFGQPHGVTSIFSNIHTRKPFVMSSFSKLISVRRINDDSVFTVSFFRAKNSSEKEKLTNILDTDSEISVADELHDQLKELVKIEHPTRKLTSEETETLISEKLGDTPAEEYGVWVYYPWLRKVVHLLDEEEFVKVRTSRNQYKITAEERDLLNTKSIGVIGLSVGQSASVTMAMERTFGEIRIADFDQLELTNLNRIRTGTQNLGLPKVTMVAREIAEIDPFLKVVPFFEGITEDNIEQFFTEGGMLDLLVEECDGVDIKILAREVAKKHRVPIVMDMSDRGCLDIERYDLEEDYPLLHGLIPDNVDYELLKGLETNEEKMPYLLPMVQTENLSARMKASLLEVGQTLGTWPQLSSDVVMGGAFATNLVRRILLDQVHVSGRYYIDPDELIRDEEEDARSSVEIALSGLEFPFLESGSSEEEKFSYQEFPPALKVELEELGLQHIQLAVHSDSLVAIRKSLADLDLATISEPQFRKAILNSSELTAIQPGLINAIQQNEMMQHLTSSPEALVFLEDNALGKGLKALSQPPGMENFPLVVLSIDNDSENSGQIQDEIEAVSDKFAEYSIKVKGTSLAPLITQNKESLGKNLRKPMSRVFENLGLDFNRQILLIASIFSWGNNHSIGEKFHSKSNEPNQKADVQI